MRNSVIVGCDPGVTGALALVERNDIRIVDAEIFDIPTYTNRTASKRKDNFIDVVPLRDWLEKRADKIDFVALERYLWFPKDGKIQITTACVNYGQLVALLRLCAIPWHEIEPAKWKNQMGLSSNKKESLALARAQHEGLAETHLTRVADHNRAEALLIADYAFWHMWMPENYKVK